MVFSDVADGVQISHVSETTMDDALDCSCAMLNLSGRDETLRRAKSGEVSCQDKDRRNPRQKHSR